MKRNKLFWVLTVFSTIILISACASPTKIEEIDKDFSCGDPVEFIYRGEKVVYGSVFGQNNTCWLDRNLGASQVCQSKDDEKCYGDLFQWGRGDDGHQDRESNTTTTLSDSDNPGHSDFIITDSFPSEWLSTQNPDLWQSKDCSNNPCPPGWRIPTKTELETELTSWNYQNSLGAFNSQLKLPSAGTRSSRGDLSDLVGYTGNVWSSTFSFAASHQLSLRPWGAKIDNSLRASGNSVRCITEIEHENIEEPKNDYEKEEKKGENLEFETFSHTTNGNYRERGNYIIKDQTALENLWKNFFSDIEMPEIDFENEMILAVFMGEISTGGYSIKIKEIIETKDNIKVITKRSSPGLYDGVPDVFTYPEHIVIVERSEKEIMFK